MNGHEENGIVPTSSRQLLSSKRKGPGSAEEESPERAGLARWQEPTVARLLQSDLTNTEHQWPTHIKNGRSPGIISLIQSADEELVLVVAGSRDIGSMRLVADEGLKHSHTKIKDFIKSMGANHYTHSFYVSSVGNEKHGKLQTYVKNQLRNHKHRGMTFREISYNKDLTGGKLPYVTVRFHEPEPVMKFGYATQQEPEFSEPVHKKHKSG